MDTKLSELLERNRMAENDPVFGHLHQAPESVTLYGSGVRVSMFSGGAPPQPGFSSHEGVAYSALCNLFP